jgi:hypothetical protein
MIRLEEKQPLKVMMSNQSQSTHGLTHPAGKAKPLYLITITRQIPCNDPNNYTVVTPGMNWTSYTVDGDIS